MQFWLGFLIGLIVAAFILASGEAIYRKLADWKGRRLVERDNADRAIAHYSNCHLVLDHSTDHSTDPFAAAVDNLAAAGMLAEDDPFRRL